MQPDVVLEAPIKTIGELNDRSHWAARHRRRKFQRDQLGWMLRQHFKPKLPCTVVCTRIAPRKLDKEDNLPSAFKAIRDAVAEWLGVDDGGDQVEWMYDQTKGAPKFYGIRIEIYGSKDDQA